jgi:hypothetical protein
MQVAIFSAMCQSMCVYLRCQVHLINHLENTWNPLSTSCNKNVYVRVSHSLVLNSPIPQPCSLLSPLLPVLFSKRLFHFKCMWNWRHSLLPSQLCYCSIDSSSVHNMWREPAWNHTELRLSGPALGDYFAVLHSCYGPEHEKGAGSAKTKLCENSSWQS